jgi:phosphatidylglycerol:prolipoprotein diacylglycerol transferase
MFPIHLNLGFRVFYYYEGFYFLSAIIAAYLLGRRNLRRAGLDVDVFTDSVLWILLGAIAGARLSHFLFWDWPALRANPMQFFQFWDGGLSITGGLAAGVLSGALCFRHHKVDFWAYAARISPAVLVGQAIGRVGCFLNGDAWGIPTALPWGVREPRFGMLVPGFRIDPSAPSAAWEWCVARGYIPASASATVPLHPTQLYESLGDLALAGLVVLVARSQVRQGVRPSRVLWLHLGGYALLRFGLEFLHGDREGAFLGGMTTLQLGLLGVVAASAVLLARPAGACPHDGSGRRMTGHRTNR